MKIHTEPVVVPEGYIAWVEEGGEAITAEQFGTTAEEAERKATQAYPIDGGLMPHYRINMQAWYACGFSIPQARYEAMKYVCAIVRRQQKRAAALAVAAAEGGR